MGGKSGSQIGGNLMLAAVLAILSYAPFEVVAKGSLIFSVFLFVFDPIPPVSRLLALITTGLVGVLSKVHRDWQESQAEEQEESSSTRLSRRHSEATTKDGREEQSESHHDGFVVVDKSDGLEHNFDKKDN